jgi:hypothetical protein
MRKANLAFCRLLLRDVLADVKRAFPDLDVRSSAICVWRFRSLRDTWEFHGPGGFHWEGTATNAYEARANGWSAYLKSKGAEASCNPLA